MKSTQHTLERAFQLARSGGVQSLDELRRTLKAEGYEAVEGHLAGSAIRKQLTQIIAAAAQPAVQAGAEA